MSFGSAVKSFAEDNKSVLGKIAGSGLEKDSAAVIGASNAPSPAPTAPPTVSTSGDATANALAMRMMARADKGFYGHMTVERCYQMSNTKGSLRSDKSSFARSSCNGMNVGKKGK